MQWTRTHAEMRSQCRIRETGADVHQYERIESIRIYLQLIVSQLVRRCRMCVCVFHSHVVYYCVENETVNTA